MKKQNFMLTIFITLLFCCAFFVFPVSTQTKTYAETTTGKINSQNCLTDYEMDSSLYKVLNKLAQHITNGDKGTIRDFDVDVFNPNMHDDTYYNTSSDYGTEILNDLKNGILNLSTGTYAEQTGYGCLKNSSNFNIRYIGGLNSLNLSNITTLILDGNSIANISGSDLSSLENLTTLKICGNKLKTFTLSSDVTNLHELDLSDNQLKKVDLSRLAETNLGVGPVANISCNEIEDINAITFSNIKLSKLDVSFNNLTNLTEEDILNLNSHLSGDAKANILIQGSTDFSKLNAGDTITVYDSSEIENFNVKFFYSENSSLYNEEESNLICSTSSSSIETINVPAGKIKIQFYSADTLITEQAFPFLNKSVLNKLVSNNQNGNYSIPISSISLRAYVNGKEVYSLKQQSDIKVVLGVKDIDNIPNKEDILSNAQYFSYRGSEKHTVGNEIEVKTNGTYSYYTYVVFDGIESARTRVQIIRQDFTGITWGIIAIVIIFVICSAGYFVFKWFKSGAQVAPLSEKEIYRYNKRRGTLAESSNDNDDYISSLDAPRHSTRVSDNTYNDSLDEDLNSSYSYNDSEEIKPTNDFPQDIDTKD